MEQYLPIGIDETDETAVGPTLDAVKLWAAIVGKVTAIPVQQ